MLTKFECLEELNLQENTLVSLPKDMSQLKTLNTLNLSNIFFNDFEQVIASIATLPALKSIYINLQEEDQVDIIMRALPELEYLNGIPVDRDMLAENKGDTENSDANMALAIRKETSKNVGDEVGELPEEDEESDAGQYTDPDIPKNTNDTVNGKLDKYLESLVSDEQSVTKNANVLAEYLDTEELEAIA